MRHFGSGNCRPGALVRRFQPGEFGLDPGDRGSKPARLAACPASQALPGRDGAPCGFRGLRKLSIRGSTAPSLGRSSASEAMLRIASRTRRIPGFGRCAKVSMVYIPAKDGAAPADWTGRDDHASAGMGASIHAPMLPASGTSTVLFGAPGPWPARVCLPEGREGIVRSPPCSRHALSPRCPPRRAARRRQARPIR